MKKQHVVALGAVLVAGAVGLDFVTAGEQRSQSKSGQQSQSQGEGQKNSPFGRVGNQGEGFSEEQTIKGRGQNPESTLGQDVQVTLGGARPVVEGEILKIAGEDYIIKDTSGSHVRVRVNKDSDMVCAGGQGQQTAMTTGRGRDEQREIPPTAHMQERSGGQQGQEQARQSGQSQQGQSQPQIGQQIVQEQLQSRQQGSAGQQSARAGQGRPESEGLTGKDVRESAKDKSAAAGAGHLGPQEGSTSFSHSGEFPAQGQQQMSQAQQSQQAMGQTQQDIGQGQRSMGQQGSQSSAQGRQGTGQGQPAQRGERIGDQSGTQTRSSLGKESGGDIAQGSGFSIGPKGGCQFKTGDKVRAQVSDLGTVLYIKQLTEEDLRSTQTASGQMLPMSEGIPPGQRESAEQRAQMMKPGSVPAPADLQSPGTTTREGQQTAKAEAQPKNLCENCKVIRGQVLLNDRDSILIKDASEKEVRLKLSDKTQLSNFSQPRAAQFVEGDRVEALATPDGYAWSITGLKQQQGQPGVIGAPGD